MGSCLTFSHTYVNVLSWNANLHLYAWQLYVCMLLSQSTCDCCTWYVTFTVRHVIVVPWYVTFIVRHVIVVAWYVTFTVRHVIVVAWYVTFTVRHVIVVPGMLLSQSDM